MNTSATNTLSSYSRAEELANTLSHGLGFVLSIIGTIFLVAYAAQDGDAWTVTGFTIYGLSLLSLYLASTLYHGSKHPLRKAIYKTLDHCAIYLLIAGSYTPFLLTSIREGSGLVLIFVVWGIALAGIALKLSYPTRFKKLRVASYVLMGWLIVVSGAELVAALDSTGLTLLTIGGVVYTLGVIFYVGDRIPYNHAIWHVFVLAGSACHFFAIYLSVIPSAGLAA